MGNDDSILLDDAIYIVQRTVRTYSGSAERHRNDIIIVSSKTLETVCKLDIRSTLPELQHEFCGLWNQLAATAQSDPPPHHGFVAMTTLKNIRKLYIALHECFSTPPTPFYTTTNDRDPILDNPNLYPLCTIHDHLPSDPIPDLLDEPPPPDGPPISMAPMLPLHFLLPTNPPIGPPDTFLTINSVPHIVSSDSLCRHILSFGCSSSRRRSTSPTTTVDSGLLPCPKCSA
jgi:hypothetical protein